jgi:tetratricopeptide (TPR) repeat protein
MSGPYPAWLLQSGAVTEVVRHYQQRLGKTGPGSEDAELLALEAQLAPHLLSASPAVLAQFPAESPLLRHRETARAALEAYAGGDPQAAAAIKAISYRSPYRDLGQILKAMLALTEDPASARTALDRLPAGSPFTPLADTARTALLPLGSPWLKRVFGLAGAEQRRMALALKGFPAKWDGLLGELARIGGDAPALLNTLLRYRTTLPAETVRPLCWRLSIHHPDGIKPCQQAFGRPQQFEEMRLQALRWEQKNYGGDATDTWLEAKALLSRGKQDQDLRIALILRHLADLAPPPDRTADRRTHDEVLGWLAESLSDDPDHIDTIVRLLAGYRSSGRLKEARTLLDDALTRFPEQAAVLLEAVELALASNAYKKAVGYARKVLELDPINGRVRAILGGAHLSHARKQIKAAKPEAALKELDQAEEWLAAGRDRGRIHLLRAMAVHDAGRSGESAGWMQQAAAELGGTTLAYAALSLETAQINRDLVPYAKTSGLTAPARLAADEVLAILRLLDGEQPSPRTAATALKPLEKPLLGAAGLKLSAADFLYVLEILAKFGQARLTVRFAEAARKQHPENPAFLYYLYLARYGDRPWMMSDRQFEELEQARQQARRQGDNRTALLIERLQGPMAFPFEDDFDDEEEDVPFGLPELPSMPPGGLNLGPEERAALVLMIQSMGEEGFIQFMKQTMSRKQFREIEQEAGRENIVPILASMLGIDLGQILSGKSKSTKQRDLFDD